MATDVQQAIQTKSFSPQEVSARTREIYDSILRDSASLDGGNFTRIHADDLRRLFDGYDTLFFDGEIRGLLQDASLQFRLSNRMTRSAGQAGRRHRCDRKGNIVGTEYEIAVSTTLLFQTFQEDHRKVMMSGIPCHDRLEALQRVIEHEMTHLIEMLLWETSKCSQPRFQSIARRFFAHTDYRHQLITPSERAYTKFGIRAGDRVRFRMDGRHYVGMVNRITKRATVLVEDPRGVRYADGKHYAKFYVPVGLLEAVEERKPA